MGTINFEVSGLAPGLLMHSPAAMRGGNGGPAKPGVKHIPSPEDEAEAGCYRMPSGQLYIPTTAFRSSIMGGLSQMKMGKLSARQVFASSLYLLDDTCPLFKPETLEPIKEYEIDARRAVVQRQGITRCRPHVPVWYTRVTFEFDDELMNPEAILDAFTRAGKVVGVLDYRPQKGGPFGRYTVSRV